MRLLGLHNSLHKDSLHNDDESALYIRSTVLSTSTILSTYLN